MPTAAPSTETIVLAGGCFWCTEAVFDRVQGVREVESGYANGEVAHPSYAQVCSGRTGHAEAVRVVFDPAQVSLRELFEIFFLTHDPSTPGRQGNDVGPQYRSGIYFETPEQAKVAREVIAEIEASGIHAAPVVTEVAPLAAYWPAEAEHQDYFLRHPGQGYCAAVIGPKLRKFQQTFAARLKQS